MWWENENFESITERPISKSGLNCYPEFHPIASSRYYSLSNTLLRLENDSKQSDAFQATKLLNQKPKIKMLVFVVVFNLQL